MSSSSLKKFDTSSSSSSSSTKVQVPILADYPNQPKNYNFPKRVFGNEKPVRQRSFQAKWFNNWSWLHCDSARDLVFCHTCVKAVESNKISLEKGNIKDSAFITTGYCNWKDATVACPQHALSKTHKNAVETMVMLPRTCGDISEMLSSSLLHERIKNRQCMIAVATSLLFLARQGLPIRGDGNDSDANFMQLLQLRKRDVPELSTWLGRKTDKYVSPTMQNVSINVFAKSVMRDIAYTIQHAFYYTIIADEVTDSSNKEQVVFCFRYIDENFEAHEEFVGLYQVDSIKSDTIVQVLKDTLVRLNLPVTNCRGQCYDGTANMAGVRNDVAKQIAD